MQILILKSNRIRGGIKFLLPVAETISATGFYYYLSQMKLKPTTLLLIVFATLIAVNAYCNEKHKKIRPAVILKVDGPYLFYRGSDSIRYLSVTNNHKIIDTLLPKKSLSEIIVRTNNLRDSFTVKINYKRAERRSSCLPSSDRIFVLSDPHSNFKDFTLLLKKEGVINNKYEWRYNNNELVIIGDVFDRGKDATTIMWLIYKLQNEASIVGGRVTYLLGNHDLMVLSNDLRYTNKKYRTLTDTLKKLEAKSTAYNPCKIKSYADMWGSESLLGDWLRSNNTIQKIGRLLFLHAGISIPMLDSLKSGAFAERENLALQLDTINHIISKSLTAKRPQTEVAKFLTGTNGPLWYRGMVFKQEKYSPLSDSDVEMIINYFNVDKIIVGHSTCEQITSLYSGHVIAVDNEDQRENKDHLGSGLRITVGRGNSYKERIIK